MKYKLNPFIRVRFEEQLYCDVFFENTTIELPDIRYLKLINMLKRPQNEIIIFNKIMEVFETSDDDTGCILEKLHENKLIVPSHYKVAENKAAKHWIKRNWTEALIFHLRTRNLNYKDISSENINLARLSYIKKQIETVGAPIFWKKVRGLESVPLKSEFSGMRQASIEELLLKRRSNGKWRSNTTTLSEINEILYCSTREAYNIRVHCESNFNDDPLLLMNSAFTSLEFHVLIFDVQGISPGLYFYDLKENALILVKKGMYNSDLSEMCIGQQRPKEAAFAIVITSVWSRYMFRYQHSRAYRNLLVQVGQQAQKFLITAQLFDMASFITPALIEEKADRLLELNNFEEAAIYVLAFR